MANMRFAVLMCAMLLVVCSEEITTLLKSIARLRFPRIKWALLLLAVGASCAPTFTKAQSLCESCEVQLGLGGTYHFWGPTGGLVLAGTLNWDGNRYELGIFRIARVQVLRDHIYTDGHIMANPYWGASLSRRWEVFQKGPVKGFVGLGMAL